MDEWLELHDRQVLVVERVAPGHEHFMAKWRALYRFHQHETPRDMRMRVNHLVRHWNGGIGFCIVDGSGVEGGGTGADASRGADTL